MFQPKHESFTIILLTSKYLLVKVILIINNGYLMFTFGKNYQLIEKIKIYTLSSSFKLKNKILSIFV